MHALFWASLTLIGYVYFGYPLLLVLGLLGRRKLVQMGKDLPTISVIVPAHNEALGIEAKIENLLALDYPHDLTEILIGSDGSTDDTEEIVERYASRGVRLIASKVQRGKSSIQNDLVDHAAGDILIFTDADCLVARDAIRHLVRNFADPHVGLVTGLTSYQNSDETDITRNESLYLRYESWLRREETDRGLLAAASGALFSMRRSLWQPLDPSLGDDFVLPLEVVLHGYRNLLEGRARVETKLTQTRSREMLRQKKRVVSKDLRGLIAKKGVLNPLRAGPVAISLWSHKALRWLAPYFLLGLFVSCLFLLDREPFRLFLTAQALFYGLAAAGLVYGKLQLRLPWSVPSAFCLMNFAALLGTLHCFTGRTTGQWRPLR